MATKQIGQKPASALCLGHTAVSILTDSIFGQTSFQQVFTVLIQKHQMIQHIRICGVALFQRNRLPLTVLGSWLLGQRIYLALLYQLPVSLFRADSFQLGIQCHAVAVCAAQVTAVLICIGIEAQMIFPRAMVVTEGAARLDLLSPQRPGVEDEPTPSGRFHDGDLIIDFDGQTESPPVRQLSVPCG